MYSRIDSSYLNARRWALTFVFALMVAAALSACNTVEGVGEDVQEGGEAIEDAAN